MFFDELKEGHMYYAISSGQLICVYYIHELTHSQAIVDRIYYPGDVWQHDYFQKESYDWPDDEDDTSDVDDEISSKIWLENSEDIKQLRMYHGPWKKDVEKYMKQYFKVVFI